MIVYEGSCANVTSVYLIERLSLSTIQHLASYSLQWLKKGNEVHVTRQALIAYSIRNFKNEVLCDVLPMDAHHSLLERPWKFDKSVVNHRQPKTYSLKLKGHSCTLAPLPASQINPTNQTNG